MSGAFELLTQADWTVLGGAVLLLFLLIVSFRSRSYVFCQYLKTMTGIRLRPDRGQTGLQDRRPRGRPRALPRPDHPRGPEGRARRDSRRGSASSRPTPRSPPSSSSRSARTSARRPARARSAAPSRAAPRPTGSSRRSPTARGPGTGPRRRGRRARRPTSSLKASSRTSFSLASGTPKTYSFFGSTGAPPLRRTASTSRSRWISWLPWKSSPTSFAFAESRPLVAGEAVGPDGLVLERERRVHEHDVVAPRALLAGQGEQRPAGRGEPEGETRRGGGAEEIASVHGRLRCRAWYDKRSPQRLAVSSAARPMSQRREDPDRALMARVEARDADALGDALRPPRRAAARALARRILGESGEAEEVLQEVFLFAWRAASSFDPARGNVLTWLLIATRSRAIDRVRSRRSALAPRARRASRTLGEGPAVAGRRRSAPRPAASGRRSAARPSASCPRTSGGRSSWRISRA